MAVSHALQVLNWRENLGRDEMPPRWMWPFPDELDIWFDGVERARTEKYSAGTGS